MRPNPQFLADFVTITREILNGKIHFLCSGITSDGWGVEWFNMGKIYKCCLGYSKDIQRQKLEVEFWWCFYKDAFTCSVVTLQVWIGKILFSLDFLPHQQGCFS